MSWRDNLREATFKNIAFHVENVSGEFGRNLVKHTFPGRDYATLEDMGRLPRDFTIDAYTIGDDHDRQAERVKGAFEEAGAGELVHPFFGTFTGYGKVSIKQSLSGGKLAMTTLKITFSESKEDQFKLTGVDLRRNLIASALQIAGESVDRFEQTITNLALAPYFFKDAIRTVKSRIDELVGYPEFFRNLNFDNIADNPRGLASNMDEGFTNYVETSTDTRADIESLVGWSQPIDFSLETDVFGSENQTQVFTALNQMIQTQAIAAAVSISPAVEWESYDAGVRVRSEITSTLDQVTAYSSDVVYSAIRDTVGYLVDVMPGSEMSGKNLIDYKNTSTLPAIILAYKLYGEVSYDDSIVNQNGVNNPNFVQGGQIVRVISNEN